MHIARVCERLPRSQIQFRISRSFRPRNPANLGSEGSRSGGSSATPWRETISEVQGTCDGRKLLLLGIQTGDKLAKPPFSVAYSRLCRHCRNLTEGGCRLSRFHFRLCRYFLDHVACRNLPWQGLMYLDFSPPSWVLLLILRSVTGSPRFPISVADQKDRSLWERDWVFPYEKRRTVYMTNRKVAWLERWPA